MSLQRILWRNLRQKIYLRYCSSNIQSTQVDEHPSLASKNVALKYRKLLLNGPNLKDFFVKENLKNQENWPEAEVVPYLKNTDFGQQRKVFFEVYGCQMNVNDTEIIWSILKESNFIKTDNEEEADVILLITCAIRESAEIKIWNRLKMLSAIRKKRSKKNMKIGILGCMAERLKEKIIERQEDVDVIAGPDSYKDLPRLLAVTENNQLAINVLLSLDETYADVMPIRLNKDSVTAFVSIMRGCDNMCTYCIVPFTRGRERSRPIDSILKEVEYLSERGIKEITLLGQNVNSYRDCSADKNTPTNLAKGFKTVYKNKIGGVRFATLLDKVADVNPEMRIRFTSPHPKDFSDEVLHVIKTRPNVCKSLHMPAQSGSSAVLERMRRGYSRESYIDLVNHIRSVIPDIAFSTDLICGFCGETEDEFNDTLSLIDIIRYNNAYLFPYSMREKTTAYRRYKDDVADEVKQDRLKRMSALYRTIVAQINSMQIGQLQLVLVEGKSKRSELYLQGRNDSNIKVIFPAGEIPQINGSQFKDINPGDYITVQINASSSQVLKGIPLYHTTIGDFCNEYSSNVHNANIEYNSMM